MFKKIEGTEDQQEIEGMMMIDQISKINSQ